MTSSETGAQTALLVEHQIDCARQLLGLLSREKDALDTRATNAVIDLAAEKERLAARLEELGSQRRALSSGGDVTSGTRWEELRDLLRACRHQNVVNGSVIELSRRFTEQLLGMIRGTSSQETLYGPEGRPLRLTGTDRFSKA